MLVSCFIIAISRRIEVPPSDVARYRAGPATIRAETVDGKVQIAISMAISEDAMTAYSVAQAKNQLPKLIDKALAGKRL